MADLQAVNEQSQLVYPDIILEIPGFETSDRYDGMFVPTLLDEKEKPVSYAKCAA